MAEETTAANVDDAAPADLRPGSNAEESATLEAVPTETSLEGINENDTEEPARAEKPESASEDSCGTLAVFEAYAFVFILPPFPLRHIIKKRCTFTSFPCTPAAPPA